MLSIQPCFNDGFKASTKAKQLQYLINYGDKLTRTEYSAALQIKLEKCRDIYGAVGGAEYH